MRYGRCLVIGGRGRNTLRTVSAAINISSARVACVTPFCLNLWMGGTTQPVDGRNQNNPTARNHFTKNFQEILRQLFRSLLQGTFLHFSYIRIYVICITHTIHIVCVEHIRIHTHTDTRYTYQTHTYIYRASDHDNRLNHQLIPLLLLLLPLLPNHQFVQHARTRPANSLNLFPLPPKTVTPLLALPCQQSPERGRVCESGRGRVLVGDCWWESRA